MNPIRAFEPRAEEIYSVHPPTIDRVNRLRALRGQPPIEADAPQTRTAEDQD